MPIDPSSQQEFSDADFAIVDNGDQSKKLKFQVSGLTTATTRTVTAPDKNVTLMSSTGDTMTGGLTAPMVVSVQVSIADDAVAAITIPFAASAGLVIISGGGIPGTSATPTGIWWIRKTATAPVEIVSPNTNVTLGTTDLTGTTTADGGYGLSVVSSTTLELENRSGGAQTMNFTFIGA